MTEEDINNQSGVGGRQDALPKIVIVGPSNVGKSILFNKFSKSYSIVSNYGQTTFSAVRKEADFAGRRWEIIDTPGIYSLNALSDDESLTRDIVLKENPERVIFCADASNLKGSLILLVQILELGIPTVFCLNKTDEAAKKGLEVDAIVLTTALGLPVVENVAVYGLGLGELEKRFRSAKPHASLTNYSPKIEKAVEELTSLFPAGKAPSRGESLLYLSGSRTVTDIFRSRYPEEIFEKSEEFLSGFRRNVSKENIWQTVFKTRDSWALELAEMATQSFPVGKLEFGDSVARLSRHPVFGWPILLGVLWGIFYGVGVVANSIAGFLDAVIFIPAADIVLGAMGNSVLSDFLVGQFGILTMGVANAIGTVVPILVIFFLIVNFLEDVGYLPNLGVLLNRILRPFGLSGKAVLPMVLGFGCNTMATMATRMLETPRERFLATFLIALGFPCAVQLGVMLAILATAPFSALLIVITAVFATQVVCGAILNRFMPSTKSPDFIIELPPFKVPQLKNIVKKTYFRLKWFLLEALPMFVFAAFMMFIMDKTGALGLIKNGLRPIVSGFLSLPEKITEVFILVLARREVGAVYFKDMVDGGEVDYYQVVVGLTVITLFVPCFSNTVAMIKELGLGKAIFINVLVVALAVAVGGALNILIRFF